MLDELVVLLSTVVQVVLDQMEKADNRIQRCPLFGEASQKLGYLRRELLLPEFRLSARSRFGSHTRSDTLSDRATWRGQLRPGVSLRPARSTAG